MEDQIDVDSLKAEMKRIHTDLKDNGEAIVRYREVGGQRVARALIEVAAHPLDGEAKTEYIKGTGEMRVFIPEKPKPKPNGKEKPKAASEDERVKVTSTSET